MEELQIQGSPKTPEQKVGAFERYKPESGRFARLSAFYLLVGLAFYGCYRLTLVLERVESLRREWISGEIPILGMPLNGSVTIATTLFLGFGLWLFWFLNRPKNAEFLIETEDELQKVTWPSFGETVDSSIVVILTVLFLAAFVMGVDILFGSVIDGLLYPG